METKIDAVSYLEVSTALGGSKKKLKEVELARDSLTSNSKALDEFVDREEELTKLVKQYLELLKNDISAFREVADVFSEADHKAAAAYIKEQNAHSRKSKKREGAQ